MRGIVAGKRAQGLKGSARTARNPPDSEERRACSGEVQSSSFEPEIEFLKQQT